MNYRARITRLRPSPAMAVALTALFVAIGGVGYAATRLPSNAVGTKQIKNKAVTNAKLANGAVTGSKVRRGSLTGSSIRSSSLGNVPSASHAGSADLLGGSPASAFLKGANAISGGDLHGTYASPTLGAIGIQYATSGGLADGQTGAATVHCPSGQRALGGGGQADVSDTDAVLLASVPVDAAGSTPFNSGDGFNGWMIRSFNPTGGANTIFPEVWVTCLA